MEKNAPPVAGALLMDSCELELEAASPVLYCSLKAAEFQTNTSLNSFKNNFKGGCLQHCQSASSNAPLLLLWARSSPGLCLIHFRLLFYFLSKYSSGGQSLLSLPPSALWLMDPNKVTVFICGISLPMIALAAHYHSLSTESFVWVSAQCPALLLLPVAFRNKLCPALLAPCHLLHSRQNFQAGFVLRSRKLDWFLHLAFLESLPKSFDAFLDPVFLMMPFWIDPLKLLE